MKFSFNGELVSFTGSVGEFIDMAGKFEAPGGDSQSARKPRSRTGKGRRSLATKVGSKATVSAGSKPKRRVSAAVAQTRQLQGQYLAAIKVLTVPQRARVKAHLDKTGNKKGAVALAKKIGKAN